MTEFFREDVIKLFRYTLEATRISLYEDTLKSLYDRLNGYGPVINEDELRDLSIHLVGELDVLGYISAELLKNKRGKALEKLREQDLLAFASLAAHYIKNRDLFLENSKTTSI